MFFELDFLNVSIFDVMRLEQGYSKTFNKDRNFDALSFRFHADTLFKTENQSVHAGDNSICFVPARANYTRIAKRDELIVVHFHSLSGYFKEIECFYPKNPETYAARFEELLACWQKKERGYKYKSSALLYGILADMYAENTEDEQPLCNEKIQKSVRYLLDNFNKEDITTAEIAERSYVSEVYFRKLFKKDFGITPKQYLVNLRIKHAEKLIGTGYYSLQEVAFACGFNDYKYFTVEFKKHTGVSPSKYVYEPNR